MSHDAVHRRTNAPVQPASQATRSSTVNAAPHALQFARSLQRARAAQAARDAGRMGAATAEPETDDDGVIAYGATTPGYFPRAIGERESGQRQGDADAQCEAARAEAARLQDVGIVLDLLAPYCECDGSFELILPDHTRLSVVIAVTAKSLRVVLGTTGAAVGTRLRRCQTELQQRLERRTGKHVTVIVL